MWGGQEFAAAVLIAIGVAYVAGGYVGLYDSGLYHLQMNRMLGAYGTLPGAALLHARFSFSSSWFALSGALGTDRLAALGNGVVTWAAMLHFASALWRLARGEGSEACRYLAAAYPVVFWESLT